MYYRLTVVFGGKTIERRDVSQQRLVIGRSTDCDLVIDNLGVSRAHSEIAMENDIPVLKDLRSNNGTFVNGKRITRHNLNDGDEVSIGKFTITFHREEEEKEEDAEGGEAAKAGGGEFTLAIDSNLMEARQRERTSKLKAYLVVEEKGVNKTVVLDRSIFTVGKSPTCDLYVGGFFTARKHCIIFRDESAFRIVDTSQKGTTVLNGTAVDDERLKDGDEIRINGRLLRFMVGVPQTVA